VQGEEPAFLGNQEFVIVGPLGDLAADLIRLVANSPLAPAVSAPRSHFAETLSVSAAD
jgi:hypothetical protein